jgi:hypothetical protein
LPSPGAFFPANSNLSAKIYDGIENNHAPNTLNEADFDISGRS